MQLAFNKQLMDLTKMPDKFNHEMGVRLWIFKSIYLFI